MLRSGDPVEQEKWIEYRDLMANAVMLHNGVDMINVLRELQQEGIRVTPEIVSGRSPYLTLSTSNDLGNIFWIWPLNRNRCSQNRSLSREAVPG